MKEYLKGFKLQVQLFLALYVTQIVCCPFIDYNDALLPTQVPMEKTEKDNPISNTETEGVYILGFWSMCIPQQQFKTYPSVESSFDDTKPEDGQLLMILSDNKSHKILNYLSIDKLQMTISHQFLFFGDDVQQLSFYFPISNYEGVWIFTLITFEPHSKMVSIETSQNQKQVLSFFLEEKYFNIIIGGKGKILEYNLNTFRGQLSKLISSQAISYSDNLFQIYSKNCVIPDQIVGEQTIEIISGLKTFDDDLVLQSSFSQIGNNFCLTGWVKYSFQKASLIVTYPLLRISVRKNYLNQISEGDELLQIYAIVQQNKPELTQLYILKDYHKTPILQKFSNSESSFIEFISNTLGTGLKYYEGLQQWHFIRYEHGKKDQNFQCLTQIYFFNDLGLVEWKAQYQQLRNSVYFLFVGGDQFQDSSFVGSIYDLTFKYNYIQLKDQNLLKCHFSCLECNGPLNTNCLTCQSNSNREYLNEQQKCQCKQNYIDLGIPICQDFKSYYKTIMIQEIEKENLIKECNDDYTYNTFEYSPQQIDYHSFSNKIETHCAKCDVGYIYLTDEQKCIYGLPNTCHQGYSQICKDEKSSDCDLTSRYQTESGVIKHITKYVCNFQDQKISTAISILYSFNCSGESEFCRICIVNKSGYYVCLECQNGYYSEQTNMKCKVCPSELNCYQCFQQQKYYEDRWRVNIRAFYKQFIELENTHPYILYAQSQNIDDFEIKCSICLSGYQLYEDKCIKQCPSQCLECQIINSENVCIKCSEDKLGRKLSLSNNECIECPSNCALCRIRTSTEIFNINPLFNNNNFEKYSYQCLMSFQDKQKDFYYDYEYNNYIDCQNYLQCQKIITIPINLYCASSNFGNQQENIYIDDLISGESFQQFENDYFYSYANEKQISKIIITLLSIEEQTCTIPGSALITQQFSKNIFSANNVEISFNFQKKVTFILENTLNFTNFSKIEIKNLIILPLQSSNLKQIFFTSAFPQLINLISLEIKYQKLTTQDQFQIQFFNISRLSIDGLLIQNLNQQFVGSLFLIVGTSYDKIMRINNLQVLDSSFYNLDFFLFYLNENDKVELYNWQIISNFRNSTFLNFSGDQYYKGYLKSNNFSFQMNIENSVIFNLENIKHLDGNNVQISNSVIKNSTLFSLNNNIMLQDLKIQNCQFLSGSIGLINSEKLSVEVIYFNFSQIIFSQNEYDETIKFILFKRFNNLNSITSITQLNISNNFNFNISDDFRIEDITSSLCYFEIDQITFTNLFINRGYGLKEISLYQMNEANFFNVTITQGQKFRFLGLHQYLDCQLQQVEGIYYDESILISAVQIIFIEDIQIFSAQSYNSPIINIISEQKIIKDQQETVTIKGLIAENNLLIVTEAEKVVSILMITSQQVTTITLQNLRYLNNILHHYVQDFLHPSGLTLFIDSYQGNILLSDSFFKSNVVFNSSDSIIQIISDSTKLVDNFFDSNNIFNYSTIQPFLLWGYTNVAQEEDIKGVFVISSESGNGVLNSQNLIISNCVIKNSMGSNGAGFQIIPQRQSLINLQNLIFENLKNSFINEQEKGGCIYIDGTSSSNLNIFITNISITNIFSRYQGGFMYLVVGNIGLSIKTEFIDILDVYSQIGSIFCIIFSDQITLPQKFIGSNIVAQYTINGMTQYFDQYYEKQIETSEKSRLFNNKTLFYFENSGIINLQDLQIRGVQYQSVIYALNIQKITLNRLNSKDNLFGNGFIYIQPNLCDENNQIIISNLDISSSSIGQSQISVPCQDNVQPSSSQNFFKCLSKSQQINGPKEISKRNQNHNSNFGRCQILNQENEIDQTQAGFIKIMSLNSYNELQIKNLKFTDIVCSVCELGLLYLNYIENSVQNQNTLNGFWFQNCSCGELGCLNIIQDQNYNRLMQNQEINLQQMDYRFILKNYTCQNNFGNYGTCLYLKNQKILLINCKFILNTANVKGGAIFIQGNQDISIVKSAITQNEAYVGGGIYLENQNIIDFLNLGTIIQNNTSTFFGDNIVSKPDNLVLVFGKINDYLPSLIIKSNSSYCLVQTNIKQYQLTNGQKFNQILLPSGQKVSSYQIFDWKNRRYLSFGQKLRLVAANSYKEIIKDLSGSYCDIKSRLFNLSSITDENLFTNNLTNLKQVTFNETSEDYNLDDLIIYFDSELSNDIVLQLEFNCSSITVPIYQLNYPYAIEKNHQNYHLRVNFRGFPCQLGEIKNYTDSSCIPCDSSQGLFTLKINSQQCQFKDELSTISVTSAQLNLKQGFWRPYLDSSQVSFCSNLMENCNGGLIEGDQSCYQGHIGAMCEQCDLYNIRGGGQYSVSKKYQCGSCNNQNQNDAIIILISLWTIISILISVQSNLKTVSDHIKTIKLHSAFLGKSVSLESNQSSIIIKMLTNYFQIISAISSFELNVPKQLQNVINVVGSPISAMVYSLDCFLINYSDIQIHYTRIVWQLILPFIYLVMFIIIYVIGTRFKVFKFQSSFFTTSLIYIYIYMQPNLIGGLIELFSYREISGYKWILANVSYRYDTAVHYKWILQLCLPMILLFAAIIPIYFFICLYKNQNKLDDKQTRYNWGYLYNEYKKQAFFWEIVKILKKELIIILLNYYQQNIVVKATIISLILGIYLELNSKLLPYQMNKLNLLDYYSTFICMISYILALGIYMAQE